MKHILVVDDNKANLAIAKQELSEEYQVTPVISGFQALQFLEKRTTDLILLDINMPEMDGKETLLKIRENPAWEAIPVIFLTADTSPETESECLGLGADDFIAKPFVPKVMKKRISRIIELNELRNDLESRLAEKTRQLELVTIQSISAIANTIDEKDKYTSGHSTRVAQCAVALAEKLGWDEETVQNLHYVALLHDIGKIGVPDIILNKPARLSDSEFEIIKKHPVMGNEILQEIKMLDHVHEGALYHHERYDGKGYPCGLKGEEIPVTARIVGIADAYDAMTSSRIYRPRLTPEDVIREFEKGKGTQFDPNFCQVFIDMLNDGFTLATEEPVEDNRGLLQNLVSDYDKSKSVESETDSLTGLYKMDRMKEKVDQSFQDGYDGCLVILHINNFESISEEKGHIAGDKLLNQVAEVLRRHTGENDILCRISGDKFTVFHRGLITEETSGKKAEEIAKDVMESLPITVSLGVAIGKGEQITFESLYRKADKALYHVENIGEASCHIFLDRIDGENRKSTVADMNNIVSIIDGETLAEKEELRKICEFAKEHKANNKGIQIVLLTIEDEHADALSLERAMKELETSILDTLPKTDVTTQYSTSQYVVVMTNAEEEEGKVIVDHMIKKFYCVNSQPGISLSYDIKKM